MSAKMLLKLIRKLRSPDNKTVLQAVEELRALGWLEDGSLERTRFQWAKLQGADLYNANLRKADLRNAHLQLANLYQANLEGAKMSGADLYGSDLSGTNLQGATLFKANLQSVRNLSDEQLAQVKCLRGAILPDGSLYDGRFSLEGDIFLAKARHIDTNDPIAMADFYAAAENTPTVSLDDPDRSLSSCSTARLIRKLRSKNNRVVIRAIEELRARGQLTDGSLAWVHLRYVKMQDADLSGADLHKAEMSMAHLQGVDLEQANLQGTRLRRANLRGAHLAGADLQGAFLTKAILQGVLDVTEEQLALASRLRCAVMPDGSRYDGRFNLAGDLADARILHVNTIDPQAMADFYAISLEEYLIGQDWSQRHLPIVWSDVFALRSHVDVECDLESLIE
jgi:uncharacterized protein YjbI with pentapeptide repeats